jgi:hypothetical protein
MKRLLDNMWIFMLSILVLSMGLSTIFYFLYMRSRIY